LARCLGALWLTAFLFTALFSPAARGDVKVAILATDSDAMVASLAINDLAREGFRVTVIGQRDFGLQGETGLADFLRGQDLLLVASWVGGLAPFLAEKDLIRDRTVLALYNTLGDDSLAGAGIVFHPEVPLYYANPTKENWINLVRLGASIKIDPRIRRDPPFVYPDNLIWRPEGDLIFVDLPSYLSWLAARGDDLSRPTVGLTLFKASLAPGKKEIVGELICALEERGYNVIAGFGDDLEVLERFFASNGESVVDIILAGAFRFHVNFGERARNALRVLDAPVFILVSLSSATTEEWRASPVGLEPTSVLWTLAVPEASGVIEPSVFMGLTRGKTVYGGSYYAPELISDSLGILLKRIDATVNLRRKDNRDKKVAILYYNHNPGKGNIGASYLNVFRSLETLLAALKAEGYGVDDFLQLDEGNLKRLILSGGRNVGSWAPGELEDLIAAGLVEKLPISEYAAWFAELPADFRDKVIARWGSPTDSRIMIKDGNILIPVIRAGNVIILPEPSRAGEEEARARYHDLALYPHHQYIAAYLWLQKEFGADAMIHLGTHATEEWLPGKAAGLSASDPSEVLMTDIPNIYPYIMDNVGEGIQAKRRGRGVIIDHLVPPLVAAEGYGDYLALKEKIGNYVQAKSVGGATEGVYFAEIEALARDLGLHAELGLAGAEDSAMVAALSAYLETLESETIPFGLHVLGKSPSPESARATAATVARANPGIDPAEVANNIALSGPRELEATLRALSGRYIEPGEGNDPARAPLALPTGRNFYGLSPARIPTRAAWELGREAAEEIVRQFRDSHDGRYPVKVAVTLWAVESLRNEGLSEATVMALAGVEPLWSPSGTLSGMRAIPAERLGRPRIDVTINASGLFRDLFPDKMAYIDEVMRLAALQDDIENFVAQNDARIKAALMEEGFAEEEATRFSRARVFSEAPGTYGIKVSSLAPASGYWESDAEIAAVYLESAGYAYGKDFAGEAALKSFSLNLKDAEAVWHSSSSNLYGLLDNDDMYSYLGGLSLAVRTLSGRAPLTLIADQRTPGQVKIESLARFLGAEIRARYLNPQWIEGMKKEDYAGAREMANYAEYLWGWQATVPEAVGEKAWDMTYAVYVLDKNGQGVPEFMDAANPFAYQSLTGRLLETARKGYWAPGEETLANLAKEYAQNVIAHGVSCAASLCDNPDLSLFALSLARDSRLISVADAALFEDILNKATGQTVAERARARGEARAAAALPTQASEANPAAASGAPEPAETVRGLRMEKVDPAGASGEGPAASAWIEWAAPAFLTLTVFLFVLGILKRGWKKERKP
jgi:cobaltochelatase CobN